MRNALIVLLLAFLTGCATTPTAIYRHPETGTSALCQFEDPGYAHGLFGILDLITVIDRSLATHRYAQCKSALEAKGFVREIQ